jgi:hypothetical protein
VKLIADSGLWGTGPRVAPAPLAAVLEISGAVLSWTVDEPADPARLTFTDPSRADWLWRVVGEMGHSAVAAALVGRVAERAATVELAGVDLVPAAVDRLRRLAVGHWLRRWWPASLRDGIVTLDAALLDAEIALLTAAAEDFFTDDTLDSDVAGLLRPHAAALDALVRGGDPRVVELVTAAAELADDVGVAMGAATDESGQTGRRDDFALAAGPGGDRPGVGGVATGVDTVGWTGVPPGVFDAAEDTVDWRVDANDNIAEAVVAVALSGLAGVTGCAVRLQSGDVGGAGVLDADGRAAFPLVDSLGQPLTESAAWNHDWRTTTVVVGAGSVESPAVRRRIRDFARARLSRPAGDAYLAEILAAESDY